MTAIARPRTMAIVSVVDQRTGFWGAFRPIVFSIDENEATRAAWSFIEGYERALSIVVENMLGFSYTASREFYYKNAPSYAMLRNWLHGDLEFEYRIACRVALRVTTTNSALAKRFAS
jgi:hypothetical protein